MYHPTLFLHDDDMIYTYVNRYIVFVNPAMLETETRSKNGCKKQHFGHAQDFENRVAHLHQEFLGVFLILFKLTCCAI